MKQHPKARDRAVYSALKGKFSGVDIVPEVVRLAAMNLYLHGITGVDSMVEAKDALAHGTTWTKAGKAWGFDSDKGMEAFAVAVRDLNAPATVWDKVGDLSAEMPKAANVLEGDYRCDYAYHAQMEPLNATAHALVRTAQRVAGAQSGSGFQEAMEQLARMAQEQQGMNGDAQGLLPMMGPGGDAMQRLRALAGRQRALAEQLERLQAGGDASAAGALAQEARELARQLEAGRLDRRTIERQERLYRKLLDAGRSLQGEEPDEQKDRTSRSATAADSVHIPAALLPGATGTGPKVRYPTWDELTGLTPEQRRMVLEYFRRLNEQKP